MIWNVVAVTMSVFAVLLLIALFFATRAARRDWAVRMEAIEREHTARLCAWGARRARAQMRIRALIRRIDEALGR